MQLALSECDLVLLSGGTSKGEGDLSYHVVSELKSPGIVAHGVALKPGKPICLAAEGGKGVVVLPGFPTSAIFTFHEFIIPVIHRLSGRQSIRNQKESAAVSSESQAVVQAKLPVKINSETGRTEYMLVNLLPTSTESADDDSRTQLQSQLVAYPMGKGSGSVTTFSQADGFIVIDRHTELIEAGTDVEVRLLSKEIKRADLVIIGSHCVGLDLLISHLRRRQYQVKFISVGSTAGLHAATRAECDLAGIHLLDEESGEYNSPFLNEDVTLLKGYQRTQGASFQER